MLLLKRDRRRSGSLVRSASGWSKCQAMAMILMSGPFGCRECPQLQLRPGSARAVKATDRPCIIATRGCLTKAGRTAPQPTRRERHRSGHAM